MKIPGIGIVALVTCLGGCSAQPTVAPDPVAVWDGIFDQVMGRYELPGLALGIIEDGEIVYVRTAGERIAGAGGEITPATLFKVASNSKAMTTSLLARLVQAGKLDWDDPVRQHLPAFRMYDPWVTEHMQVSDLLVHNSGLPQGAGDLMLWPEPNSFTRADILAGLAYLEPAFSFRSGYAYDNLLYVVAGEVAAAAGGATYEELLRREVFEPLGLGCKVGEWRLDDVDSVAQPHMRVDGRNVVVRADAAVVPMITSAAAGGIRCSLDDMLLWARNWLNPDAAQLAWLSAEQRRALWTPRTLMPVGQRSRDWNDTRFHAYAFGFRLADVDGVLSVSHTGTLMGMYSVMTLLPERRSGFVMLMNGQGGQARTVLNQVLLKHFTAPESGATVAAYADALRQDAARGIDRGSGGNDLPDTSPRSPAVAEGDGLRSGIWSDPWFGEVSICPHDDLLRWTSAKSPLLTGVVMRVGERYLVDWDDESVDVEAWLHFSGHEAGPPTVLTMSKTDPKADFSFDYEDLSFTRTADCD